MPTKFTNSITDLLNAHPARTVYKMWGGQTLVPMGDGVRFKVTRSPKVDYVYIRYLGYGVNKKFEIENQKFEVEFAVLVDTEYDVLDRISPVSAKNLVSTISQKLFFDVNHLP